MCGVNVVNTECNVNAEHKLKVFNQQRLRIILALGQLQKTVRHCDRMQVPYGWSYTTLTRSWLLHDDLHWLDVPQRVQYKLAVMVHCCLGRQAPSYLADYCVPVSTVPGR